MDCEKFEAAMMDELYGELDELTSAAMKRHVAGCARCAALFGGLKATRRLAGIAPVPPPDGLEERILAATRDMASVIPLRRRLASVVSLAGGWAMRPQTAMAAVFLVMIGTSVLLLSGKATRAPASSAITVTEQGSPAPEATMVAEVSSATSPPIFAPPGQVMGATPTPPAASVASGGPREETLMHGATRGYGPPSPPAKDDLATLSGSDVPAAAPAATASPQPQPGSGAVGGDDLDRGGGGLDKKSVSPFNAAVQSYQAGRYDEATRAFDGLAPGDATAELWAARSVRESKGCRAALARFDHIAQRAAGSPPAWDGLLEGALCYRSIGQFNDARTRLTALLGVDSHKDRARAELDRLNQLQSGQGGGAGAAAPARPARRAAPAPAATPPPRERPPASAVDTAY